MKSFIVLLSIVFSPFLQSSFYRNSFTHSVLKSGSFIIARSFSTPPTPACPSTLKTNIIQHTKSLKKLIDINWDLIKKIQASIYNYGFSQPTIYNQIIDKDPYALKMLYEIRNHNQNIGKEILESFTHIRSSITSLTDNDTTKNKLHFLFKKLNKTASIYQNSLNKLNATLFTVHNPYNDD